MLIRNTLNTFFKVHTRLIIILFSIFYLSSCVTDLSMKNNKDNKNNILKRFLLKYPDATSYNDLLYVDIESQHLFYIKKGTVFKTYAISSSKYGTGSSLNSLKTPLGKHKIFKKIGSELPLNSILKGRVWTGEIANIVKDPIETDYDIVTSRILWLEGLEEGKNKGKGVDSKDRYIYLHGTAEEGLIGTIASDGCIRMYNIDVIELFDLVSVNTEVWIY